MNRNQYIDLLVRNNNGLILYNYHKEKANRPLQFQEFAYKLSKLEMLSSVRAFDLIGFIQYVRSYYGTKFNICILTDKDNRVIKVY